MGLCWSDFIEREGCQLQHSKELLHLCHVRAYPNLNISVYKISLFKLHFGDSALRVCMRDAMAVCFYLPVSKRDVFVLRLKEQKPSERF